MKQEHCLNCSGLYTIDYRDRGTSCRLMAWSVQQPATAVIPIPLHAVLLACCCNCCLAVSKVGGGRMTLSHQEPR